MARYRVKHFPSMKCWAVQEYRGDDFRFPWGIISVHITEEEARQQLPDEGR